jgi:hypothetical protein
MYIWLGTADTLHKKLRRIGPGLCGTPEKTPSPTFANKSKKKGRSP